MILTVDVGNTNIKVGAWDGEQLAFLSRLQTKPLATSDEYAVTLLNLFDLGNFNRGQFDGAIVSSVVPQLSQGIVAAIKKVIQISNVVLVSPGLKTGLNIKIDDPATLGSDMVCAGVAVTHHYPLPALIISLGTATAIFAINENAEFLGGSLAPGVVLSMNALSAGAAQLPYISLDQPKKLIGTNTIDSMTSGIIYGTASMLDGMIEKMEEELGGDVTVIASGGLASTIVPYCQKEILLDDHLVLEGLRLIYHKNFPL